LVAALVFLGPSAPWTPSDFSVRDVANSATNDAKLNARRRNAVHGYKLVNPKAIRELYRAGIGELIVYLATAIAIVATDLLVGVLSGVGAAVLKLLWHFARLDVVVEEDAAQQRVDVRLFGAATFVQLPKLADALEHLPAEREVHIHLAHVAYIDHASLDLLRNFERARHEAGTMVLIDWNEPIARRANRPVAEVRQAAGEKTDHPVA
jgi:MFS superfamily sulfate permease-like transporter